MRDLSDEEAFRWAPSKSEIVRVCPVTRAIDYVDAVALLYGGRQKAMAERLEVGQLWLSRHSQFTSCLLAFHVVERRALLTR
ncbi:MAG: hypothetical protein ABJD13_03455 [Paracoccaceae bacterium]